VLEVEVEVAVEVDAVIEIDVIVKVEARSMPERKEGSYCQPGTSDHKIPVNCISHVSLRHLLTHVGCRYNRSL
jgi:hypothetical protein